MDTCQRFEQNMKCVRANKVHADTKHDPKDVTTTLQQTQDQEIAERHEKDQR